MIAPSTNALRTDAAPAWHEPFLNMLPAIRKQARVAFHRCDPESREDAVEEVVTNALVAYARLVELGKAALAYPTPLANYAIRQVRDGQGHWYKSGQGLVPIRWVFVRDDTGTRRDEYFYTTHPEFEAATLSPARRRRPTGLSRSGRRTISLSAA